MTETNIPFFITLLIIAAILFILSFLIWLFSCHGKDKIKNPKEWKNAGSSGEQILYTTLRNKIHIPENQILRNVFIPTADGKTSEIDILVVSKKGLLVFECKNYAGHMYGDMKHTKWIQYLGKQKNYFYNPFLQNQNHIKHLKKYLGQFGDLPAYSFVTTISRGQWKIKNLNSNNYFLGYNCHLTDVYHTLEDSDLIKHHYATIMHKLTPLSRPSQEIQTKHISDVASIQHT